MDHLLVFTWLWTSTDDSTWSYFGSHSIDIWVMMERPTCGQTQTAKITFTALYFLKVYLCMNWQWITKKSLSKKVINNCFECAQNEPPNAPYDDESKDNGDSVGFNEVKVHLNPNQDKLDFLTSRPGHQFSKLSPLKHGVVPMMYYDCARLYSIFKLLICEMSVTTTPMTREKIMRKMHWWCYIHFENLKIFRSMKDTGAFSSENFNYSWKMKKHNVEKGFDILP